MWVPLVRSDEDLSFMSILNMAQPQKGVSLAFWSIQLRRSKCVDRMRPAVICRYKFCIIQSIHRIMNNMLLDNVAKPASLA